MQVVTNHDELHRFAADRCVARLREGAVHEVMIKVGGARPCARPVCLPARPLPPPRPASPRSALLLLCSP